jgi:hypothetical protein
MRRQDDETFSMQNIRGPLRMCASTTPEFRGKVRQAAIDEGISAQEFVLLAVRDRMRKQRGSSLEERRLRALRAAFQSKRTPEYVKRALEALLSPFLPEA